MENLDIIDSNDNVIGINTRHESYKNFTTNRIISVVIFNKEGKIALQKRSLTCSYMPGGWGLSAGGHVSSGETYLDSAKRELKEEIGVICDLKFKDKFYGDRLEWDLKYGVNNNPSKKHHYFFETIFEGHYDGDFKFDDGEVDKIEFFSIKELKNIIENNDILLTNGCRFILEKYYF